jgi:hypothetical protein
VIFLSSYSPSLQDDVTVGNTVHLSLYVRAATTMSNKELCNRTNPDRVFLSSALWNQDWFSRHPFPTAWQVADVAFELDLRYSPWVTWQCVARLELSPWQVIVIIMMYGWFHSVHIIDYRCEARIFFFFLRIKRWRWCYLIGHDYLFRKTLTITPKKLTVQPADAFEDTAFKPGFEIVKL